MIHIFVGVLFLSFVQSKVESYTVDCGPKSNNFPVWDWNENEVELNNIYNCQKNNSFFFIYHSLSHGTII